MVKLTLSIQPPLQRSDPGQLAIPAGNRIDSYRSCGIKVEYKKRLAEGLGTEKAPRILAFKNKVNADLRRCLFICCY